MRTGEGQLGGIGMGVAQNGIGPGSWLSQLQGGMNNPMGLLGNAGEWIMNNPGSAARIGLGIGSLINAGTQGSSGGGGGQGLPWQNGPLPTFNPSMSPFQQNPYLNQRVPFMSGEPFMRGY